MPYKDPQAQRAAQHASYLRRKDRIIAQQRKRRQDLRQKLQEYKVEHGCSVCGYNKYAGAIDAHHPDGKDSQEDCIARLVKRNFSWERILERLEECVLLCANCHREHHAR